MILSASAACRHPPTGAACSNGLLACVGLGQAACKWQQIEEPAMSPWAPPGRHPAALAHGQSPYWVGDVVADISGLKNRGSDNLSICGEAAYTQCRSFFTQNYLFSHFQPITAFSTGGQTILPQKLSGRAPTGGNPFSSYNRHAVSFQAVVSR